MTDIQTAPDAVNETRVAQIECDLISGPLRLTARLAASSGSAGIKAIWRNETGSANFTGLVRI